MWEDIAIVSDRPIEYSEDRKRGERPDLKPVIEAVRGRLNAQARCKVHPREAGTHLIDIYRSPRVVCDSCYRAWCDMTPIERRGHR